jgi:uncharacterized membrane protein
VEPIISNPRACLGAGVAIAAAVLVIWLVAGGADTFGLVSFLIRLLHVLAAMVWVGFIVFVNFVQLVALRATDDQGREVLHKAIVPHVAWWFRHASTAAVLSGALLLLLTGYLAPSLVYGTGVYLPPPRVMLVWLGVLGALVMWMFVHMYIWPNMQVVLGLRPGDAAAKSAARDRVMTFARLNLILAVPVTLAMVAAAHLY